MTRSKRIRRQLSKFDEVKIGILRSLRSGGKTFDELFAAFETRGISDHYLSEVIALMLLYDGSITQKEREEVRTYYETRHN
jgi:hypothetical protein